MPRVNGDKFSGTSFNRKKSILILKKISNSLKNLHDLGIICADLPTNILVNKDDRINFIDHDNFSVDGLPVDIKNIYLKTYEKHIAKFDQNFDNYLLNIFTLGILTKIYTPYIYDNFNMNPKKFMFKDDEINQIIQSTFKLNDTYTEDIIVDKINSKNDMKKIGRKIF